MRDTCRIFLRAVMAGVTIAIGGTVYLSLENKIAGSLFFTVGLYVIVLNGLNLYTGKIGYLVEQKEMFPYIRMLALTWLGNLVGTVVAASAVKVSRISGSSEKAAELCNGKLSDSMASILILAIFCGILMYVAVDGFQERGNPLILFLCVSVFILSGFEHCIANMFYFTLAEMWSFKTFLYLLLMTIGNSLGGMMIPAVKKI